MGLFKFMQHMAETPSGMILLLIFFASGLFIISRILRMIIALIIWKCEDNPGNYIYFFIGVCALIMFIVFIGAML